MMEQVGFPPCNFCFFELLYGCVQAARIISYLSSFKEEERPQSVVISKKFYKGGHRHSHAHILGVAQLQPRPYFRDGNMIIYFNTDIV